MRWHVAVNGSRAISSAAIRCSVPRSVTCLHSHSGGESGRVGLVAVVGVNPQPGVDTVKAQALSTLDLQ
jgi:hypothetical protein